MQTIGLIGGMSWESTLPYYRLVNEATRDRLGGLHSARLVLVSVDFHEIERLQHAGDWVAAGAVLADAARALQSAGADFIVLCTNTMHKVAPAIEAAVAIPLLHIADATAAAIRKDGLRRVGLLGTRFTMEQAFYRERLAREGWTLDADASELEGPPDLPRWTTWRRAGYGALKLSAAAGTHPKTGRRVTVLTAETALKP